MTTRIKTLKLGEDQILPRTVSNAVTMGDGTTLEASIANRSTDDIKIKGTTATSLGVVDGTSLSSVLVNYVHNTDNILAAAEAVPV